MINQIRLCIFIAAIFISFSKTPLFAEPNDVIIFGDSANDNGYFAINPKTAGGSDTVTSGVETLRPGLVWSESFGARFGVSIKSVDGDTTNATTNGGNNYSASGARISNEFTSGDTGTWTTENQVDRYLSDNNGYANSNAIYAFGSSNDLKFYQDLDNTGGTNYIHSDNYVWSSGYGDFNDLVSDYTNQLVKIKNAGGNYFLVSRDLVSAPSQAMADVFNSADVIYDETAYSEISQYNSSLLSSLQSAGINVIWFDKENVLVDVVNNYANFGLTTYGMQHRACTLDGSETYSYSIGTLYGNDTYGTLACASDAQTAYWSVDGAHLAPAVQNIISDAQYNLFVAPIQISYLPETTFKARNNINNVINEQISSSFTKEKSLNTWMNIDSALFNQKKQSTGYQDVGSQMYSLLLGSDYKFSKNYLLGTSLSFSRTINSYGDDRGEFTQDETALSIYGSYNRDTEGYNFLANAVLSYGMIDNEINRLVPIGITTQHLNSDTNSSDTSLELNAKYNMKHPITTYSSFYHGPSTRLLMQRVKVDAFEESNTGTMSSIALGFNKQDTTSILADAGYVIGIKNKAWNYYIDPHLVYELSDLTRKINTRVISYSTAPSYYLMTPEKDRYYVNIITGVNFAPSESITTRLALQSLINKDSEYTYVLSLNLGYSF